MQHFIQKFTVSLLHFYELVISIELEDWTPILTRVHCTFIMGVLVRVNQYPPAYHEGWMMDGQETLFHQIPVPWLTMKLRLVSAVTTYHLLTTP
jgi:hypothetical protein